MAQYLPLPDGSFVTIRENETPLQAYERATQQYPEAFGIKPPAPKEGVGAAFQGGLEGLLSRARTGVEAIFDPEEAARRGVERGEAIGQEFAPGASLQRVKDVYAERGLLPAAGEAISQIPSALAEQAPNIAATLASAKLGAMGGTAVAPGIGTVIGGVGGALAPSLLQLFGSNVERQAAEQLEAGRPLDISRGAALAAAAPGAALEVASTFIPLGRNIVGKLLGPQAREVMERGTAEAREALAQEGLLRVLGKGTAVGAAVEIPTEVTQQMLERLQAGLPITSDDALAEYGEAAYGAGLVGGPFGAAGRVGQRSVARGELEEKRLAEQAAEEAKTAEETRLAKEAEEAKKATPEYEQEITQRLEAVVAESNELKEIKKQKDLDPDVRKEVGAKIVELEKERKKLESELQQSKRLQGKVPTLEQVQEKRRAEAQAKAAEKDRAAAEQFGMPLFTGEEATRDLFLTDKGEARFSTLPDVEAQQRIAAEKEELTRVLNKQYQTVNSERARLSSVIAANPESEQASIAAQELSRLNNIKKQIEDFAKPDAKRTERPYGIPLEVEKGEKERKFGQVEVEPSRAELSAAKTKQSSLIRQIKTAADLGDSDKVSKLQKQLQSTLQSISELEKQPFTPDLFGAENLGRLARRRSREAYAGLLAEQELGMARRAARAEEKVNAEADRFAQVGEYVERIQERKGIELLGVAPQDKERVSRMLEEGSLPPDLSQQLFNTPNLSLDNVAAKVAELESKLKSQYDTFISELATTDKAESQLLDKNGMLTKVGAQVMRDEVRLRELKKILARQQAVAQERAERRGPSELVTPEDFERKIPTGELDEQGQPIFTSPTLGPLSAQLQQTPEVLGPETQETTNRRDRNVLMSYFQDAIYALQRGYFSGLRGGVQDPYEADRNAKLEERISDAQVEIDILRAQIQASPQDAQNLERRITTLQGRQKMLRAGISASQREAAQTYDELLKEAQRIRDEFVQRATIEVNAARVAKGLPEIKVLTDDQGKPIVDQLNSFISKAANAKRTLGDKRTKLVDEFGQPVTDEEGKQLEVRQKRGDPSERPFAKVGYALDTLQEQIEDDIRRAKGEKTLKEEINESLEVELSKPEQKRAIQDRSRIGRLAREIEALEAQLAQLAPPGPELDLVTDPEIRNEILESIVTILPPGQRKGLEVGIDGGTFVESAIKKQLELARNLEKLPEDFLFDYVETDLTLGRFLGASGGVKGLEETLRRVQAVRQGPPEIREAIEKKKDEIQEVKKELREEAGKFGFRYSEEELATALRKGLQDEYNALMQELNGDPDNDVIGLLERLETLKKSKTAPAKTIKDAEKQIESLREQAASIYEAFKKLASAEEKVVTYPKTARFSQQVDAMAKLEDLSDDVNADVARAREDIKTVKDATKKLTAIDNQLYALSLQPKTEARTEKTKKLRSERTKIVNSVSKQFKDLREEVQLPDEESTTIGIAKQKLLADLKAFAKKFDSVTSDVIAPLQKKERELKAKLFKLRGKRDALPDEIEVDSDTAKKAEALQKEISDTVKELRSTRSELLAKRSAFEKEAVTEAAQLKARENELYFPYASKLNKRAIGDAVNEELKDIDAEIGGLQGQITQLKEDKKQAEERLTAANKLAKSGDTAEARAQARVDAKEVKAEIASIVDLLNKTNETIIARGELRDAEATKLAEKFAREPEGRYNKSFGKLLAKLEARLPDILTKSQRVTRARRIVENRVMNQERMRTDRTDKLAEFLQRSLVSFKKRVANSETRIKELERQRLAAATVGRMTSPDGAMLSGVRVENVVKSRKVSEEFEQSKEQLAKLDSEMAEIQERLDEDAEKPADAKDRLSASKIRSLNGQLANRRGRRNRLMLEIDPAGVSIEIDRLRAELATTTDKAVAKRLRSQIAKFERNLRGENQLYEIEKTKTFFGTGDKEVVTVFEQAQGYVRENHIQLTPTEMDLEATAKRQLDRQIIEAEQNLAIEMAGGNKTLITNAKAALRELRKKRDELSVYRNRKQLTEKQLEKEIQELESAEKNYQFEKGVEDIDLADIPDIDTSGGPIEFRLGAEPHDVINTKEATKRLEEIKKITDKAEIKFEFYPNIASTPVRVLKQMAAQGMETTASRVKGGVMPDGTVFVIVENHNNMLDLEKTLAHELIGHYSFDSLLGKDGMLNLMLRLDKNLATKVNESGIENLAERLGLKDQYNGAVAETFNFYREQLKAGKISERDVRRMAKIQGLKELVAYTMEKRVDKSWLSKAIEFIKELVRAFRMWLKGHRFSDLAKQSTTELFDLMQQAENSFSIGKPMAYYTDNNMVSLRSTPAPANTTPLSHMVAKPSSALGFLKANLMGMNFRVQFVDRLAALDALVKKGVEKSIIPALKAMDVLYFSRFAGQRNNFAAEYLTNGVGRIEKVKGEKMYVGGQGPSMKDVANALRTSGIPAKDLETAFTAFLIARRAEVVGVDKLDYSEKITQREVDATLAKFKGNKAFEKAAELYDQYNNNLIDLLVQAEALDPKKAERLKNSKYVPYYREKNNGIELVIGTEKPVRIGNFDDQPSLRELKGGIEKILPVFTGSVQNTQMIVDIVLRNMAAKSTAFTLHEMGLMDIRTGDGPRTPRANVVRFTMLEDKDGEKKLVEKYAMMKPEVGATIFGNIPTELVVRGMEGIKTTVPGLVRLMGLPANWLRSFVTKNPRYAVNQVFRDSMAAVITTGANFAPVVQTVKDMATMNRSGALGLLRGRGVVGGQVIVGATDDAEKILRQITAGKPGWEMAMAKLDEFAMMGDAATRVSMYNSFLKQGLSEREATFATLEAMNFSRRGLSPSVLWASTLIPFFNAQVQGLDVLYRAWTGDMPAQQRLQVQQKMKARLTMMAAFTLAYAMMMEEDEAYKNANPEERYSNWFVPTPFGTFRVPIPFELGLVGKALPEGLYRMALTDDKNSDVLKALRTQLFRSIPGDLPTAIKAPVELMLNKSFFTDRPIIDQRLEGLVKSEQFGQKTPELIKMLGFDSPEAIKKIFGLEGVSPAQVEYLIKGYTGTLPVALLRLLDPVFASGEVVKAEMKLPDVPIIGSFFQPKDAGGQINAAFAGVEQAQRVSNTFKKMMEDGRREEAVAYIKENLSSMTLASAGGTFRQQMGELTKAERAIRGSDLSAKEKRERLEELRKFKIEYAKQFRDFTEQIKRQDALS